MSTIYERFNVTFQQVQSCERLINPTTRKAYYVVASSKNDGTEYRVFTDSHNKLVCTCKAGLDGMNCWHKRAAMAHNVEYQSTKRALLEKERAIAENEIAEEIAAIHEQEAITLDGDTAYNRKPFEFLR